MLTFDQLNTLSGPIIDILERFQLSVIRDIARRLVKLNFASAAWQVQRLTESGLLYEQVLEELSKLTGQSEAVLRQTFQNAGVTAIKFDDAIYRAAGLSPIPLRLSPAMLNTLMAGLEKTNGIIRNLTMTTAISAQNSFINAADLAYLQVSTGAMDYNSAIRAAVKDVANQGLSAISYVGRKDQIDVAMRRTVLTGINQTVGKLTETRADEMGADLVQTSAHIGARPTHQIWQGKIFSRSGTHKKYPNFVEETGYGTVTGLSGINCRHSFYVFFEGISENAYKDLTEYEGKPVTYNGKEITFYDATQKQRYIEREIRKAKREASALEAAGLDNTNELAKVKSMQASMRDFIKQTGLNRQSVRELI